MEVKKKGGVRMEQGYNIGKGVSKKGLKNLQAIVSLIDHPQREKIEKRIKIIEFYDSYGNQITKEAFGVSRTSVYRWKKELKESNGKLVSLSPKSKRPLKVRIRTVETEIKRFIIEYRQKHPRVGQEVIKPQLDKYCKQEGKRTVSVATIGRMIKDMKKSGELDGSEMISYMNGRTGKIHYRQKIRQRKKRRKGYVPKEAGDLLQIDSIHIFADKIKKYIITAIDLKTRFAFASMYDSLSSSSAKDFMEKLITVAPFKIKHIQTDNGGEFEKHFQDYVRKNNIVHFHTYPRHPQSNGHIERFNRTIQEQFVDCYEHPLEDALAFNKDMMEYLIWYNTEKPHMGINKQTPLDYLAVSSLLNHKKSHMYRDRTAS